MGAVQLYPRSLAYGWYRATILSILPSNYQLSMATQFPHLESHFRERCPIRPKPSSPFLLPAPAQHGLIYLFSHTCLAIISAPITLNWALSLTSPRHSPVMPSLCGPPSPTLHTAAARHLRDHGGPEGLCTRCPFTAPQAETLPPPFPLTQT